MQWLMLQQENPDDFVIATGTQHSVREFVDLAAKELGIYLKWEGKGVNEKGIVSSINSSKIQQRLIRKDTRQNTNIPKPGDVIVRVDPRYFRPAEVKTLLGDPTKARKMLGWEPRITFEQMVQEMIQHDLEDAQKDHLCKMEGFKVCNFHE